MSKFWSIIQWTGSDLPGTKGNLVTPRDMAAGFLSDSEESIHRSCLCYFHRSELFISA